MKLKKIENQVRHYAPLTLSLKRERLTTDQININELLDENGNIVPTTTLFQINASIINESPYAEPRWLVDGRVVDLSLNLLDLADHKHIHPNRETPSLQYQLEILIKQLSEAVTYDDIDNWYGKIGLLFKRSLKRNETATLFNLLKLEIASSEKLIGAKKEYVGSLLKQLEHKFLGT